MCKSIQYMCVNDFWLCVWFHFINFKKKGHNTFSSQISSGKRYHIKKNSWSDCLILTLNAVTKLAPQSLGLSKL